MDPPLLQFTYQRRSVELDEDVSLRRSVLQSPDSREIVIDRTDRRKSIGTVCIYATQCIVWTERSYDAFAQEISLRS